MTDFVTSLIRTYVPVIVGSLIAWLAAKGVAVDVDAVAGLTAFLSALFTAIYYFVVRLIERSYPQAGVLLGSTRKPEYTAPAQ